MSNVPSHLIGTYCIQEHNAKRAGWHEDFRFERGGIAVSWAIPKGLPLKGDKARLGIRTEDHPMRYMEWEGVIPNGSCGVGSVRIVDHGRCNVLEFGDDRIKVKLSAGMPKRSGVYSLRDIGRGWLIVHKTTEH